MEPALYVKKKWDTIYGTLEISEAVKFFNLNALSSPILVKVHFDVVMTMIADTLYNMLAQKLRGFQDCDAPKIYRCFIKGKANITRQYTNPYMGFDPTRNPVEHWTHFDLGAFQGAKTAFDNHYK